MLASQLRALDAHQMQVGLLRILHRDAGVGDFPTEPVMARLEMGSRCSIRNSVASGFQRVAFAFTQSFSPEDEEGTHGEDEIAQRRERKTHLGKHQGPER